jgi:hypothetical protein
VTSQGSAYARFRRALDNGSVTNALACAAELKPLGLTDSLELLLLIREKAPERYGRAALRWHSRFVREVPGVELDEAQAILATLAVLAGERKRSAAFALAELLIRRGFEQPCELLVAWARDAQ